MGKTRRTEKNKAKRQQNHVDSKQPQQFAVRVVGRFYLLFGLVPCYPGCLGGMNVEGYNVGRGEKRLLCGPRFELPLPLPVLLLLGGSEKEGEDKKWDGKKK